MRKFLLIFVVAAIVGGGVAALTTPKDTPKEVTQSTKRGTETAKTIIDIAVEESHEKAINDGTLLELSFSESDGVYWVDMVISESMVLAADKKPELFSDLLQSHCKLTEQMTKIFKDNGSNLVGGVIIVNGANQERMLAQVKDGEIIYNFKEGNN